MYLVPTSAEESGTAALDVLFDLSPDLMCVAGPDGYFRKVNPAATRILGYSESELLQRPFPDFVLEEVTVDTEAILLEPILSFPNVGGITDTTATAVLGNSILSNCTAPAKRSQNRGQNKNRKRRSGNRRKGKK